MKIINSKRLLNFLAIASIVCIPTIGIANICAPGIGGTGKQTADKGIGGTGKQTGDKGIGGTGKLLAEGSGIGGTGIVGTITGFGSICVNGVRVKYKKNIPVYINNRRTKLNKLAIGQVVTVDTHNNGNTVTAKRININYTLAAPVQFINKQKYKFMALGQIVQLRKALRHKIDNIKPGHYVEVSGLRKADGTIIASAIHVSETKNNKPVYVTGTISKSSHKRFFINGLEIKINSHNTPKYKTGARVTVHGNVSKHGLKIGRVVKHNARPFSGRYRHLLLEGYLAHSAQSGLLKFNGHSIAVNNRTDVFGGNIQNLIKNARIRIYVKLDSDSRMIARAIQIDLDHSDRQSEIKSAKDKAPDTKRNVKKSSEKSDDDGTEKGSSKKEKESEKDDDSSEKDETEKDDDDSEKEEPEKEEAEEVEPPEPPETP